MERIRFINILKISGFRNLWLSQAISQIFVNVLYFSLMIRIYELTNSNTAVSLLVLTITVPNFLVGAIAGVLVDRWDRKLVMFLAHFFRVFAVLAFFISSESLVWIYILSALISLITQFFFPAEAATIGEVVKDRKLLLTANSLYSLTFFSSVIIGNVLAGPIIQTFGARGNFLIVALAFATASFFSAKVPGHSILAFFEKILARRELSSPIEKQLLKKGTLLQDFRAGLHYIKNKALVRRALYIMALGQILIGTLASIAPGFASKVLLLPAANVSLLIMAPAALGMILGGIILGQFHHQTPKENLIKFGFFSASLMLLIFGEVDVFARFFHSPLVPMSVLILVLLGASNAFLDIPVNTTIQENTPTEIRSRVYGVLSTVTGAASILPIFLAGAIADLFGVRVVMILIGLGLLAAAIINNKKIDYVASHS